MTYTPYGRARHHWLADINGDGAVMISELTAIASAYGDVIGDSEYRSEMDLNRDGVIDGDDASLASGEGLKSALADGLISDAATVDNQIGYDGYVFNAEAELYCVRFRTYDPRLGRWLERDPAAYTDSMNLSEYVRSMPLVYVDPAGQGIFEWILTGEWDPDPNVLAAAKQGWLEGYGMIPFTEASLGQFLYTGDWNADDEILLGVMQSPEITDVADCVLTCYACMNSKVLNWLAAASTSGIMHGGIPKPIAKLIAGRGGLSTTGQQYWKSLFRSFAVRFRGSGFGEINHRHAQAFKNAGAAGRVARGGAVAAALLQVYIAGHCALNCVENPCYDCDNDSGDSASSGASSVSGNRAVEPKDGPDAGSGHGRSVGGSMNHPVHY